MKIKCDDFKNTQIVQEKKPKMVLKHDHLHAHTCEKQVLYWDFSVHF